MAGTRSGGRVVGIILVVIAGLAVVIGTNDGNKARFDSLVDKAMPSPQTVDVSLLVGSEKRDFFTDPEVVDAFEDEGFNISVSTMGSLEMNERARDGTLPEHDFYFPAGMDNRDLRSRVDDSAGEQLQVRSDIALIARRDVAEDLRTQLYFKEENGQYYVEPSRLFNLLSTDNRWRDVSESYPSPRRVGVISSNPARSSSAAHFAYLMADTAMQGQLNTVAAKREAGRRVLPIFQGQGLTEGSSGDAFDQFVSSNGQDSPLAVAYNSQFFALAHHQPEVAQNFVLVNISPTVMVLHDLIADADAPEAERFYEAMRTDEDILNLMIGHGFFPTGPHSDPRLFEGTDDSQLAHPEYLDPHPTAGEVEAFAAQFESVM